MTVRDLTILGCSSQQPTRFRNHSAYLLRWNDEGSFCLILEKERSVNLSMPTLHPRLFHEFLSPIFMATTVSD